MLGVDDRERDEHGAEARSESSPGRRAEDREARDDQRCRDELDRRVERRDARVAVPAPPAQEEVRDDRDVVAPRDLDRARPARGRRAEDRAARGHARDDDVQEAPDRQRGREDEGGGGGVHGLYPA